jgi:exopolysaccharide biosynthesis polyprenyl glycosylphosphotransferase
MTEYVSAYGSPPTAYTATSASDPASTMARPLRPGSGRTSLAAYRQRAICSDLLVSGLITLMIYLLKFGEILGNRSWLLYVAPLMWVLAIAAGGGYRRSHLGTGPEEYRSIGRAALLVACAFAMVSFTFELELPRSIVLPFVPTATVGSLWVHSLWRKDLWKRRVRGHALLTTVAVGRADSVASLIQEIGSEPACGMRVVAACVSGLDGSWESQTAIDGVPIFGPPEMALAAVDALGAEVVAVSSHPDLVGKPLRRLAWSLAERDVDLLVSPGIVEVAGPRLSLRPAAGLSMLHVERPTGSGARLVLKRVADTLMAALLVIVLLPVLLVISLAVKIADRGPVFYRQERIGAQSEPFPMFKFRTMVVDAERQLDITRADGVNSVLFKQRDDPRVTRVGRFLRKYSLDELPQLFNVLLGEMSLVGPRPPLAREVALYESDAVQRLRVRPGMTGLWQISGRSDLSYEQSVRLDLWYVDNWSPVLDLQILVRTLKAVVSGNGAY